MPDQTCPCCAWTYAIPEQADDAFVSCPECGQVLAAPAPWSAVDVPICDTRRMIAWPGDAQDTPATEAVLVPWELTCQTGKVGRGTPGTLIPQGLFAVGFGILFLAAAVWAPPGEFLRGFGPLVGLLMLVSGAIAVYCGVRKLRRRTRARAVRLAEPLPDEAQRLGPPIALHQVRLFWRGAYFCLGTILCMIAGVSGAMVSAGQVRDHRVVEIAIIGWPAGLYMVWQAMRLQARRFLVFAEGVVTFEEGRTVLCRWDQIDEIWLTLKEKEGSAVQRFVLTLRREDGEKLVFTSDTEYIENQLVARVQFEHATRQLPGLQVRLDAGAALEFGALWLDRDGLHRDEESVPWSKIGAVVVVGTKLRISAHGGTWQFNVAAVPNVTVLLALVRQRAGLISLAARL